MHQSRPSAIARPAPPAKRANTPRGEARERILDAAHDLFSRHGMRAVGVDAVAARSGVAKMTLYRHFASKDELVLAFLQTREDRWTKAWLSSEVGNRAATPGGRLLAVFDVFDEWFQRDDFEGCSFINVLLESADRGSRVHRASVDHLATIRAFLERLAAEGGCEDPDAFAHQWHILMKGSIVSAAEGDRLAARRARQVGELLLREHGLA